MIVVNDLLKKLMRKNKKELQKLMREKTREANKKIINWKNSGAYNRLPIQTQQLIKTWTITKGRYKGLFQMHFKNAKKKDIAMQIIKALTFLGIQEPDINEDEIDENMIDAVDNFKIWYDPSEFWGIYWNTYSNTMSKSEYLAWGKQLAQESKSQEEMYTKLMGGNWI